MAKEITITANSEQEALEQAYRELGVSSQQCDAQVLQPAKKSLFGKIKQQAIVKVTVVRDADTVRTAPPVIKQDEPKAVKSAVPGKEIKEETVESPAEEAQKEQNNNNSAKLQAAQEYLQAILEKMGVEGVTMTVEEGEESATITLNGEHLGILIGHHGETLDSLQHLTTLVCNRLDGKYFRVTLDCGQYRDKRQKALKDLAKRTSIKVARTGRSQMLEPMNPYERRIVHSVVTEMEGVTSKSKGEDPNRRVVILPTNPRPKSSRDSYDRRRSGGSRGYDRRGSRRDHPLERVSTEGTMEKILKAERTEEEKKAKKYSKIEF